MPKTAKQTTKRPPSVSALLSKPPRTEAEAIAQIEAIVKRDRKMLERLSKL